jgi:hypothetical protein
MTYSEILRQRIHGAFRTTEGLVDLVDDDMLSWKPESGENWMTTGQLLHHISNSCGAGMKGFVTGDWGFPEGVDPSSIPPEEMLPPAEKLPGFDSLNEAKEAIQKDKEIALEILNSVSEDDFSGKMAKAPWAPVERPLGDWLLEMVDHLNSHKSQLFYYLKLQGKPVHTGHLWGM